MLGATILMLVVCFSVLLEMLMTRDGMIGLESFVMIKLNLSLMNLYSMNINLYIMVYLFNFCVVRSLRLFRLSLHCRRTFLFKINVLYSIESIGLTAFLIMHSKKT